LIHNIAKIIAKMIALQLEPLMNDLISNAQSVFIKKRSIHDYFMYVGNLARRLHKSNIPTVLFKLDIHQAFEDYTKATYQRSFSSLTFTRLSTPLDGSSLLSSSRGMDSHSRLDHRFVLHLLVEGPSQRGRRLAYQAWKGS
jgi:hypothetical protein